MATQAPKETWEARPHAGLVKVCRSVVRALERIHPVRLEGAERVPSGPAILVGNHGLLGYESPFFFERIEAEVGRLPIGLADKWFFKVPGLRDVLVRVGGTHGTAANGLAALRKGELVVCYPGGAREVLKTMDQRYRCLWERSIGFARLSLLTGAPIVPFAAAGIDHTFDVVGHLRGTGKLLMNDHKYDLPVVWGRGPLPRPVPFWFRLGEPIAPPAGARAGDLGALLALHRQVWDRTQMLVDGLVTEWEAAHGTGTRERTVPVPAASGTRLVEGAPPEVHEAAQ